MHSTAKVYAHPRSPYYQAYFNIWDARRQAWKITSKSTRCTDEAKALGIARQLEKLALKAGGAHGDARVSREFFLGILNSIMEISGQPTHTESRTWAEYSTEWLSIQEGRQNAGDIDVRTVDAYRSHISHFTKWLGKDATTSMALITGQTTQAWYLDMIEEGRKPGTVNNAVKTLLTIFERSKNEGFIERNPIELIIRQYGEADIREPFTLADIAAILKLLQTTGQQDWLTVALLGLCTGQRLQDCAQAQWKDFSQSGTTLVWTVKQMKTDAIVPVPITEPLASHLAKVPASARIGHLSPTLVGIPTGGNKGLSMQFSDILTASGIARVVREKVEDSKGQTWTDKTFHSFRHTTNSLLANAGVNDDVRRKILGHASTKMNTRYTHLEIKTTLDALQKALRLVG